MEHTDHYLAMLWANHQEFGDEQLQQFAQTYRQIEGDQTLRQAIAEFEQIIKCDDWTFLEELVSDMQVEGFTPECFLRMKAAAREVLDASSDLRI